MFTSLSSSNKFRHSTGAQALPLSLKDQLNALLDEDDDTDVVVVPVSPQPATIHATEAICTSLTEFERTAKRQRELFLQSLAHQAKPLYLTRTLAAARELAEKGEWVARFQKPKRVKKMTSGSDRRSRWSRMLAQGIFLLDEHSLFDWSVYTLAKDMVAEMRSGPLAEVFAVDPRIIFRWKPVNTELAFPAGGDEVAPRDWGKVGSVELAAFAVICSVAPILRRWEEGIKRLSVMALDSSKEFRRTVVGGCLRPHGINIKAFERFQREEKRRRHQLQVEGKEALPLGM